MIRRFLFLIFTFIFVFSIGCSAYEIDDRNSSFSYSSRSSVSSSDAYSGTLSSLSSGNSSYIGFSGSFLSVYLSSARNSGTFNIFIDGEIVYSGALSPTVDYSGKQLVYQTSDLSSGDHILTIVCPDNTVTDAVSGYVASGRVYIDYIDVETDPDLSSSEVFDILTFVFILLLFIITVFDLIRRLVVI